jgi:glycosyltransferase involved in cell wall biosynthesis
MVPAVPQISVVIPYFNAETYMNEAVWSVRTQHFGGWELLLVDDGSTDGSRTIAERHNWEDPDRIILVPADTDRRGAAAARNRGVAAARAPLIAFLDADDWYAPAKLGNDIRALTANSDCGWSYHPTNWCNEAGRQMWRERLGLTTERVYKPPYLFKRILIQERGDVPCTCAVTIRRDLFLELGGFEESFALYEDQTLWAKLMLEAPAYVRSGADAYYRRHAASTTDIAISAGHYHQFGPHPSRDAFLNWAADYAEPRSLPPTIWSSLVKARTSSGPLGRAARTARRLTRYAPWLP